MIWELEIARIIRELEIARAMREVLDLPPPMAAPEVKSRELLLSWLSPIQRMSLERLGWFLVKGGTSGRWYRLRTDAGNYNITTAVSRDREVKICFAPSGSMPTCDRFLGQMLSLQYNEHNALRVANFSPDTCRLYC